MMKQLLTYAIMLGLSFVSGCAQSRMSNDQGLSLSVMYAMHTTEPINLDGRHDENIWQTAPIYTLSKSRDQQDNKAVANGQGYVQLAHDEEYLYVAIRFEDADVVAEGDRDQLHHYQFGDLAEVFLKPTRESWYWEMYVTPQSHKTVFFFPSRGRLGLPSGFNPSDVDARLDVAAQVQGTCNNWRDRDTGWTGEMAISKTKLSAMGVPFNVDESWTILIGRYNYSRYLDNKELTMHPPLSLTDFHQYHEYASLVLDPAITK